MAPFRTPLDIANRALQHVGAQVGVITSLTETSRSAVEVNKCYDGLRRAELRRNVWRFATKKAILRAIDTTSVLIDPLLYSATRFYPPGSVVSDSLGLLWTTRTGTLGQAPGTGEPPWDAYYGPLMATPYDSTLSYNTGELTYKTVGVNVLKIYRSLVTSNTEDPGVPDQWSATALYNRTQTVEYLGYYFMSLIDRNQDQTPGAYAVWQAGVTYAKDDVAASMVDGHVYSSLVDSNTGNEPSATAGSDWNDTGVLNPWAQVYEGGVGSNEWVYLFTAVEAPNIIYPLNTGPVSQSTTRNAFRLPSNYLRTAPRDPKAGINAWLGAPSRLMTTDWNFEGDFITSQFADPFMFRFVADVTNVNEMDDMFCEGLACRVAEAICEPLTQSTAKLSAIASEYKKFMGEARLINGIEVGSTEPEEDEYITVRR